ncbi:MAG: hypothetical protein CMM31_05005 [Rhodospirillaceae bacterium]|nr:hypothetical protein [Rhodospirillaceae bacterium]
MIDLFDQTGALCYLFLRIWAACRRDPLARTKAAIRILGSDTMTMNGARMRALNGVCNADGDARAARTRH